MTSDKINTRECCTVGDSTLAEKPRLAKPLFVYGGHHFLPVGVINKTQTLKDLSKVIVSDKRLGMWVASYSTFMGQSKIDYSYKAFYTACGNIPCDVFKCLDNGKLYMPGDNELFLYRGQFSPYVKL